MIDLIISVENKNGKIVITLQPKCKRNSARLIKRRTSILHRLSKKRPRIPYE
jgi:hypothetical protein